MHRDLKPSNVLISPDGPRVIDFGVARAAERIQLTVTRGAVGTPAYMAPEQARDTRQATIASDVFSLGAMMVFAATGHAPYQGETVMDVLVRLATEPPDLSGLPADLADVVRACLDRDPRGRPGPAAVIARLAPRGHPGAGERELGPASLPAPALDLIAEYRHDPRPPPASPSPFIGAAAARAGAEWVSGEEPEPAEDATFGSRPAPGEPDGAVARRRGPWPGPIAAGFTGGAGGSRWRGGGSRDGPALAGRRRWLRLLVAAWPAAAVAALVAAGAGGFAIADSQRHPPPGPPPGFAVPPPDQLSARPGSGPQVTLYQNSGDGSTVFVLHGVGWAPGQALTVALAGVGASPDHPVVDGAGTFNYAINQDHEFFRGPLPIGTYSVVVTWAGGTRAVTSFVVHPPPGPTSTTGPPGASTTLGR